MTLQWEVRRDKGCAAVLYAASMTGRWDGNEWGEEWTCGFCIQKEPVGWSLYDDDGQGNGDHRGDFFDIFEAAYVAEQIDRCGQ